jgi:hypothetical protein
VCELLDSFVITKSRLLFASFSSIETLKEAFQQRMKAAPVTTGKTAKAQFSDGIKSDL